MSSSTWWAPDPDRTGGSVATRSRRGLRRLAVVMLAAPTGSPPRRVAAHAALSAGAVALASSGLVHLYLWADGYRNVATIGPLFLAQALAGLVLAVSLVAYPRTFTAALGATYLLASIAALALSATRWLLRLHGQARRAMGDTGARHRIGWCRLADPRRCARGPSALSTSAQSRELPERNDDEPNPSPVHDPVHRRACDHRCRRRRHHVSSIDECRQSSSAPRVIADGAAAEHHHTAAAEHHHTAAAAAEHHDAAAAEHHDAAAAADATAAAAADRSARSPDEPTAAAIRERQRRRQQRWTR